MYDGDQVRMVAEIRIGRERKISVQEAMMKERKSRAMRARTRAFALGCGLM